MNISNFINNLKDSVECLENHEVTPETAFQKIPNWDSLAILCTIAMADSEYNVELKGSEISQCKDISDLYQVIDSKAS